MGVKAHCAELCVNTEKEVDMCVCLEIRVLLAPLCGGKYSGLVWALQKLCSVALEKHGSGLIAGHESAVGLQWV